jgi:hypothetical protein
MWILPTPPKVVKQLPTAGAASPRSLAVDL